MVFADPILGFEAFGAGAIASNLAFPYLDVRDELHNRTFISSLSVALLSSA